MSSRKVDVEEKKASSLYSSHDIVKAMSEFLEEVWICPTLCCTNVPRRYPKLDKF